MEAEERITTVKRAVLVYQAGIANVFEVEAFNMNDFGRNARRLIQGDFRGCEMFARGLAAAGVQVASAACNQAGDIVGARWKAMLEGKSIDEQGNTPPFSEHMHPVWAGVSADRAFA